MTICPSCGKDKAESKPLCAACFYALPACNRVFLYAGDPLDRNAAIAAAVDWLATNRHWKANRTAKRNVERRTNNVR